MNIVLYRPIRRIVAQRNQVMEEKRGAAERAEADTAEALREFEQRIHAARLEGRQKYQEFKDGAHVQEKDLLQQAAEQAAKDVAEMRQKVVKEIGAARKRLRTQVQAFSTDLAQKILGRSI
jgi:F-type H+-transporting ATPase subunit b